MESTETRFYKGPNLLTYAAGFRFAVKPCAITEIWANQPKDTARKAIELIRASVPIWPESELLKDARKVIDHPAPLDCLINILGELLLRDFCSSPQPGRFWHKTNGQTVYFYYCDNEIIGTTACQFVLNLLTEAATAEDIGSKQKTAIFKKYIQARKVSVAKGLSQSSIVLIREALSRNIPFIRETTPDYFVQLGYGKHRQRLLESKTSQTSILAELSRNKLLTSLRLAEAGLPTASTRNIASAAELAAVADNLQFPLVIKPLGGSKGRGVSTNINDIETAKAAYQAASDGRTAVIAEKFIAGEDHRLLVVNGELIAAAIRIPGGVKGDGKHSIRELVSLLNKDPQRGYIPFERLREQLIIDDRTVQLLAKHELTLESIPKNGQWIQLKETANISTGGHSIDVTDEVHPDNKFAIERAADLIGLDVAGIDFISPDISKSWRSVPSAIIEVNACPGLRPHLGADHPRDVTKPIIDTLFITGETGRIPCIGVTGSVGKTTTVQMLRASLMANDWQVGATTTQGIWINDQIVSEGDFSGGMAATSLLQSSKIDVGVFEFARDGLVNFGIRPEKLDIGIILNVHDMHLNQDGVTTVEQLANIKGLVARNATQLAVLNADHSHCLNQKQFCRAQRIALLSLSEDNPELIAHGKTGQPIAFLSAHNQLVLIDKRKIIGRIPLEDIPDSHGGAFRAIALNCLASIVALHELKTPFANIKAGLTAFRSNPITNPGRHNLFRQLPYTLLHIHCDGAAPAREIVELVRGLPITGKKRLIVTEAPNRSNEYYAASMALYAGNFDEYIVTQELHNLRQREDGEIPALLKEYLVAAGVAADKIKCVADDYESFTLGRSGLTDRDLLVANLGQKTVMSQIPDLEVNYH